MEIEMRGDIACDIKCDNFNVLICIFVTSSHVLLYLQQFYCVIVQVTVALDQYSVCTTDISKGNVDVSWNFSQPLKTWSSCDTERQQQKIWHSLSLYGSRSFAGILRQHACHCPAKIIHTNTWSLFQTFQCCWVCFNFVSRCLWHTIQACPTRGLLQCRIFPPEHILNPNLATTRLPIIYFPLPQSPWNSASKTAVILPYFVQTFNFNVFACIFVTSSHVFQYLPWFYCKFVQFTANLNQYFVCTADFVKGKSLYVAISDSLWKHCVPVILNDTKRWTKQQQRIHKPMSSYEARSFALILGQHACHYATNIIHMKCVSKFSV